MAFGRYAYASSDHDDDDDDVVGRMATDPFTCIHNTFGTVKLLQYSGVQRNTNNI